MTGHAKMTLLGGMPHHAPARRRPHDHIADLGQSPQDGFTEYQPFPAPGSPPRPRWGDYSWGIYLPGGSDRLYFANEYIQFPNCTGSAFTLTIGTCGGTRDGLANWGTSVNYVVP
jgi:hypothetical protein